MKKLLLILTFVLFSYSANAEGKDFKQWTCYEFFNDSNVVLTIGYFPDSMKKGDSVGLMKLITNNHHRPHPWYETTPPHPASAHPTRALLPYTSHRFSPCTHFRSARGI